MKYIPPKSLFEWEVVNDSDIPYSVSIMDNETVISAYGKYAHYSGCKIVTWAEFLDGEMNSLVTDTMGSKILNEALTKLREIT